MVIGNWWVVRGATSGVPGKRQAFVELAIEFIDGQVKNTFHGDRHAFVAPAANEFLPTVENKKAPPGPAPEGMVWIPGGEFSMGAQDPTDMHDAVGMQATTDSRPVHRVFVDGFWMDATEVTNEQFARFVKATGYVTVAEQTPRAEDFPGAPPESLVPGSVIFTPPDRAVPLTDAYQWWSEVNRRQGAFSGGAYRVCGRSCVCAMGRQAPADRGGMGVRGARRSDGADLSVGQ